MIIANGTIEFKAKTSTGLDEKDGFPIPPSEIWSKPIPCQYFHSRSDLLARVGTENMEAVNYTILIEEEAQSERLRLKNNKGTVIGEFSAISIDPLQAVGQTKIVI